MSKMVAAVRQAVARAMDPVMDWAALRYQKALEKNLRKYGLRYDDLLDPLQDMDTAEALRRLPQEEYDARQQRLKRAMDASLKHTPLDKEVQKQQTPFLPYLQQPLRQVKAEREEKAELGADQPYQRSIP
jgi:ubiquinol-cytochrome c reductase subunit 7